MSSHLVPLNFRNLGNLDQGRIGKALEKHLATMAVDIVNRPCDAAGKVHKRQVQITLDLIPETGIGEFGSVELQGITGEVQITSKMPAHRSSPVSFKVGNAGQGLMFNPDIPGKEGLSQPPIPGTGHHDAEGMDDDD